MAPELANSLLRSSSTTEGLTADTETKIELKQIADPQSPLLLFNLWPRRETTPDEAWGAGRGGRGRGGVGPCDCTHGMLERWSVADGGKMLE